MKNYTMLKAAFIAVVILGLCTAFTQAIGEEIYPTIVLSEKYSRVGDHTGEAKTYYLKPSAGLLIDARKLKLVGAKQVPSKLFLMSDGVIYVMPFSSEKVMIADALHLSNLQGIKAFDGFKLNTIYSIGIGELELRDGKVTVDTRWACLLKVK